VSVSTDLRTRLAKASATVRQSATKLGAAGELGDRRESRVTQSSASVDFVPGASEAQSMRALIVKEFRELVRDHRTLAMLVVMPLLLLVVFGYAANFYVDDVEAAAVGPQAEQLASQAPETFDVTVVEPSQDRADAETLLRENEVDVAFVTGQQPVQALVDGSNLFAAQSAVATLNRAGDAVSTEVLFNPDLKTSWVMVPAIIGLILTFVGTIITSIGLVREREAGTIEQLAVMPIRPSTVILGKIAPYFLLASLDMVIVTVLGVLLFDVPFNGSVLAYVLGAAVFLFVVLGIGVFISTVSHTAGQAIQLAFLLLPPQILLSGMIFPLEAMAAGVRWIGYLLPLTYFTMISQGIMLRGASVPSLWLAYLVLAVMAVVVFTGATLRFRRDLAPGRRARGGHVADQDAPAATRSGGS
jgi:ABC-2 type transport system permease protein